MTIGQVIAISFFVFGMICLFVVAKFNYFKPESFKKFFIATTAVYLSGTILVFAIVFAQKAIPWTFAVASEISMIIVYAFSMYMIGRMGKNFLSITEDIEKRKVLKDNNDEENN